MTRKPTPSSRFAGPSVSGTLAGWRSQVDRALPRLLPRGKGWPPRLVEAMEYSLTAGGKRLRPLLAMAVADACGADPRRALPAGCALELVHTYSLVHDDLPSMDDDDLRRGAPTSHKVFGEALAILAGDALLTLAFEVLAGIRGLDVSTRLALVREVAAAAGGGGMVGGQVEDMAAEGSGAGLEVVGRIHALKTGALITAAARLGAISAGARPGLLGAATGYGRNLGAAFQITDDILDEEGDRGRLGKTPGSDRRRGKATWPAAAGIDAAREAAAGHVAAARRAAARFAPREATLLGMATMVLERRS